MPYLNQLPTGRQMSLEDQALLKKHRFVPRHLRAQVLHLIMVCDADSLLTTGKVDRQKYIKVFDNVHPT